MAKTLPMEQVIPIGARVLIRKDEYAKQTKAGIHLPSTMVINNLTGRILALSKQVENDPDYASLRVYQRVIFSHSRAVPVDLEQKECPHLVVPVEDVVAVIEKEKQTVKEPVST